jgi:hypothetical protein
MTVATTTWPIAMIDAMIDATTGGATGAIGIGIGTTGDSTSEESSAPNGRTRRSRAAEVFHRP